MSAFVYKIPERFRQLADFQVGGTRLDPDTYLKQSEWEYNAIEPFLPRPRKVLDLGCGLGRGATYLNARFGDPGIHFVLADTTHQTVTNPKTGWDPGEDFYNDLELTAEFVRINGLENFELFDIRCGDWSQLQEVDLLVSLLSVGFHFPIEPVIERLLQACNSDCTMIFGARSGRYNRWSFREHFADVHLVRGSGGDHKRTKQQFLILRRRRSVSPSPVNILAWHTLEQLVRSAQALRSLGLRALARVQRLLGA